MIDALKLAILTARRRLSNPAKNGTLMTRIWRTLMNADKHTFW